MEPRFYRAGRQAQDRLLPNKVPHKLACKPNAPGSSGALPLRHAVQHDVLLAEFEPRIGPGLDIISQRLRALLPIVAVHAAVGLWGSFRVTHGIEPQAIEGVAHDQFAKRLE